MHAFPTHTLFHTHPFTPFTFLISATHYLPYFRLFRAHFLTSSQTYIQLLLSQPDSTNCYLSYSSLPVCHFALNLHSPSSSSPLTPILSPHTVPYNKSILYTSFMPYTTHSNHISYNLYTTNLPRFLYTRHSIRLQARITLKTLCSLYSILHLTILSLLSCQIIILYIPLCILFGPLYKTNSSS